MINNVDLQGKSPEDIFQSRELSAAFGEFLIQTLKLKKDKDATRDYNTGDTLYRTTQGPKSACGLGRTVLEFLVNRDTYVSDRL